MNSSLNINGFISMKNKKEFYLLSFALIVVMLGFGMVIPIFPFYIENMGAGRRELACGTMQCSLRIGQYP